MSKDWIVKREDIIDAIDTLSMIPSRPGIITSEFIKIDGKKDKVIMTMASEVSGYTEVKGKGGWPFEKTSIYIDRRLFDPFIMVARNIKSKSDFYFSKSGKNELSISNGNRKVKLTCSTPKSGYESLGKLVGKEVKSEDGLNLLLLAAKHCAEESSSEPEKNCVYIRNHGSKVVIYATTGTLSLKAEVKSKLKLNEPIPFPLYIIDLFSSRKLKGIETTKKDVVLDFGNGKVWQAMAVTAKKKFPWKQIDKLVDKERKTSKLAFVVDSKSFGVIIERLAGYLGSVRRLDWTLQLVGKNNSHKLDTIVPLGHTTFKDRTQSKKTIKYDFKVDLPFDRVIGILQVIASIGEKIYWSFDSENRSYIKSGNIELLIGRRTN